MSDPARLQVTASTGIAALNIGGNTLHSFAGIGLGELPIQQSLAKIWGNKAAYYRWLATEVLVIDEISMVSAELFDLIDNIGRQIRQNTRPFGGIQLVVSGDFFQLPPVPEERDIYTGRKMEPQYAFETKCWNATFPKAYKLTRVFRQANTPFIRLLDELRYGVPTEDTMGILKELNRPIKHDDGILPTEIYPHKNSAETANLSHLAKLKAQQYTYQSIDKCGTDRFTELKVKLLTDLKWILREHLRLDKSLDGLQVLNFSRSSVFVSKKVIDWDNALSTAPMA
ncbi:unnamed protein product [Rhizoctonia solani]|uniref:ATP-dependent DNA helicase n=1 Tax=Rhizoctonia solani TaxID=456999 RepID=A0A8H3HT73_9AGAM|nr:unnamed protein product [Rhizoctonia solani]